VLFPEGLEYWVLLLKCMFYYNIPCAALFVFFYAMSWWDLLPCVSICNCNKPCAATVWNVGVFSFLPWGDGSCSLVCEAVFIDIPCAATVWTFVCFLFLLWVDGCCMVIRKLQVIEIPCAATVCLCSVIRSICVLFCSENWWKMMPCLLMLFIAVNAMYRL